MKNVDRVEIWIRRGIAVSAVAGIVLAGWLAVASTTDWLDLPRGGRENEDGTSLEYESTVRPNIGPEEVRKVILGKAIFRSTRIREAPVVDDSGRYVLLGTALGGGKARAYIKDAKLEKTMTLFEGDQLGTRYVVQAIERDSVELQRGSESTVLRK